MSRTSREILQKTVNKDVQESSVRPRRGSSESQQSLHSLANIARNVLPEFWELRKFPKDFCVNTSSSSVSNIWEERQNIRPQTIMSTLAPPTSFSPAPTTPQQTTHALLSPPSTGQPYTASPVAHRRAPSIVPGALSLTVPANPHAGMIHNSYASPFGASGGVDSRQHGSMQMPIPDPAAVQNQKDTYIKLLDAQLAQGIQALDIQLKQHREAITSQAEQQKRAFNMQVDMEVGLVVGIVVGGSSVLFGERKERRELLGMRRYDDSC